MPLGQAFGQLVRAEQVKSTNSYYTNLADQLMSQRAYQEAFTPTNGQTVFTLSKEYVPGTHMLKVFVNGTLQPITLAYTETDKTTVTFVDGLFDSDYVVFRVEGDSGQSVNNYVHGHVYHEVPTGTIDGTNDTFSLARLPIANTEQVFINGVLQEPGVDYNMTGDGSVITFLSGEVPLTGDKLKVHYDIQVG